VSIETVLNLILGANLGYKVESGYILITTKEKMQQNLPMSTYPVQDLLAQIPDFGNKAPRFEIGAVTTAAAGAAGGGAGGGGGLFGVTPGAAAATPEPVMGSQELLDIIQKTVNQQSDPRVAAWDSEGGVAHIDYLNGMLIVTQTRRGHERLSELLEQLRRERAIMISVEARFCSVSDQFLQDISLDVDAVLASSRYNSSTYMSPGLGGVVDPGSTATSSGGVGGFVTLPGSAGPYNPAPGTQVGQPIFISNTSSNGQGVAKLLPLTGTAFADFTANEGGIAISGTFLDDIQVGFLLRAIQSDVRSTTLQAPRITLFNGQRSYISMATVVSYISGINPVVAEAAVGWQPTIAAIPVGVTLDVKATVSADRRYVQMDLRPQLAGTPSFRQVLVSAAVPGIGGLGGGIASAPIDLPTVTVQDMQTTVSVPDGGTLLLGGLRRFDETEAESGVPVLSKIPILKRLFDNRATLRQATNTLILVRPKIIIQAEEEQKLGYDEF
jgi:type II secretory pathway component GspD/PulD (secretin)